ncbi:MAG: phosphoribosylformylglycinamidine cyclo-ligase, partial [Thermomonas sp.]
MNAAAKIAVSRAREPAVTAPQPPTVSGLTYRDAGVDIDAG